jgi:RHS repeat-associated protein
VRYVDDLVLRDRDTTGGGTLNERLYALQDANWNVTALADKTGSVQERYAYDAYGVAAVLTPGFAARTTSSFSWETRYAAYHWDVETGLYHVRLRSYHPGLGCFLSRDPLRGSVGSSLYVYVPNNPLRAIDPWGAFVLYEVVGTDLLEVAGGASAGSGTLVIVGGFAILIVETGVLWWGAWQLGEAITKLQQVQARGAALDAAIRAIQARAAERAARLAEDLARKCRPITRPRREPRQRRCEERHPDYLDCAAIRGERDAVTPRSAALQPPRDADPEGWRVLEQPVANVICNAGREEAEAYCPGRAGSLRGLLYLCTVHAVNRFGQFQRIGFSIRCCPCCHTYRAGQSCRNLHRSGMGSRLQRGE